MQMTRNAQVLDTVVRMVVPMRREFGFSVDVQVFMRDTSYAQQVLGQALTSQVQRLRQYAEFVRSHVQAAQAVPAAPAAPAARPIRPEQPAVQPGLPGIAAQRREAAHRLLDLAGPAAEPLCIKLEKSRTADELTALLAQARQIVSSVRGDKAAREFMTGFSQTH